MPFFTFMGSNILRRDDPYSLQVITETIDTVVPPLIKVRRERRREGGREGGKGVEEGRERGWSEGGIKGGRERGWSEGGREGEVHHRMYKKVHYSVLNVYYYSLLDQRCWILLSYIDLDTIEDLNKFCYPIS